MLAWLGSKCSKLGFSSIWSKYFQIWKADFKKDRGTRDQIATILWIMEKAKEFQKNIYFYFFGYTKAFECVITTSCGNFLKRWDYQTNLLSLEKPVWGSRATVRVRHYQLSSSNYERSMTKLYIHYPSCLTYMQTISCEIPGWMSHKLESRFLGEISTTSNRQMIPL